MLHDLRALLRRTEGVDGAPTAAVIDGRTLQGTPESGARSGHDGHKRRNGSKPHAAVDTLGHLQPRRATPAGAQDGAEVGELAAALQAVTGRSVEPAWVDQGSAGAAPAHGIVLEVVKPPEARRGFVLRPRRWVVERSRAWTSRSRRPARGHERLPKTEEGMHLLAFACLMRHMRRPESITGSR